VNFEFEFRNVQSKTTASGCFGKLFCNNEPLCDIEEWLFRSCAVFGMSGFSTNYHNILWTPELVEALILWFADNKGAQGGYPWREILFCLTCYQADEMSALVKSPHVKLIDKFTNKAHSGTPMRLYRLSVDKDFKHHEK
jgi:hypothetical protein